MIVNKLEVKRCPASTITSDSHLVESIPPKLLSLRGNGRLPTHHGGCTAVHQERRAALMSSTSLHLVRTCCHAVRIFLSKRLEEFVRRYLAELLTCTASQMESRGLWSVIPLASVFSLAYMLANAHRSLPGLLPSEQSSRSIVTHRLHTASPCMCAAPPSLIRKGQVAPSRLSKRLPLRARATS